MLKVKSMILNILLEKAALTGRLEVGTTLVDIEASEILSILETQGLMKSKSSVNKAMSELCDEGIISFNSAPKSKIRQVSVNNVLFFSSFDQLKNSMVFRFDPEYLDNLVDAMRIENGVRIKGNAENIHLFDKTFDDMRLYVENAKVGINTVPNINGKLSQFVMIDVDEDKIDSGLYGKESFLLNMENSGPPRVNFPQNLRKFRSFRGKNKLMYVLYSTNSMYSRYFIEYSTIDLKFPQNLRKFRRLKNGISLDTGANVRYKTSEGSMNMSSSSFIGKVKEDYKKKQPPPLAGDDLFGSSTEGWKNVDDEKRSYSKLPLSAFKTFDWVAYGSDLYEKVNGKPYPRSRNSEAILLANKVYPKLFDELKWSAEDFKSFIDRNLNQSKSAYVRENFFFGFIVSNEIRMGEVENFTKERRSLRKNDHFENIIYLSHIPILSEDETTKSPLDKIMSLCEGNETAIIYNYGICNYHRFLQLNGMTFDEATLKIANHFKNEIIGNILAKDKDIGRRYIDGVAKNTTIWEPYSENDSCRPARNVLAWREVFSKLWRNKDVDVTVNDWWANYPNYSLAVIPSVKKFFASTKKIINNAS